MKENEAPEKIYLPYKDDRLIGLVKTEGVKFNSGVDGHIEYIRADAFVDKAKKWFEKQNEWHDINGIKHCDMEDFEDFVNYMEGDMTDVIEVNGMKFEKTRLLPNFQGVYASDPCPECHLDIHWVDYGGECLCGKIDCARVNRKDPHVWCIVGGLDNLKIK